MIRKIVAIGGGKNGRIKDGVHEPYETESIDREIVRLTGKEKPNFLFIGHANLEEAQETYFQTMKRIYGDMFGCECKDIKTSELSDLDAVSKKVEWADIIYEGGGNTLDMIKLWQDTGFDKLLRAAWENGTVMCGVSAGGNCWFKECSSDSLQIKYGPDQPLIKVDCLGFVDGLFVPHCDAPGRLEHVKELLKESNQIGVSVSNCAAIEIVGDEYRLLTADASNYNMKAYAVKSYWENGEYLTQNLDDSDTFKPLSELTARDIK